MMLSEWKTFLWACALVAGCGAVLSIAFLAWLLFGGRVSPFLELSTMSLIFLGFLCGLAAVLLLTEHTRAAHAGNTGDERKAARRRPKIPGPTARCPRELKIAAVAGIVFASVQFLPIGDVSAALGQEMTVTELRGFLAGASVFFCLSLPVIVSAALMEGGYE